MNVVTAEFKQINFPTYESALEHMIFGNISGAIDFNLFKRGDVYEAVVYSKHNWKRTFDSKDSWKRIFGATFTTEEEYNLLLEKAQQAVERYATQRMADMDLFESILVTTE